MAVDLDDTLVYLKDGRAGFYKILAEWGFTHELAEQITREIAFGPGFSFGRLIKRLEVESGHPLSAGLLPRLTTYQERNVTPYPDSRKYLERWLGLVPVAIVTAADSNHQMRKLEIADLPFSEFHAVEPRGGSKAMIIRDLYRRYGRVAFVDDLPMNLDGIRQAGLTSEQVLTFQIRRPLSRQSEPSPHHQQVTSLDEVDAAAFG